MTGCSEVLKATKAQDGCQVFQGTCQHAAYQESNSRLCVLSGLIPVQLAKKKYNIEVLLITLEKMQYELHILNPHACPKSNKFRKILPLI